MTARIVDRETKRQEIYKSAMKLFAQQGIAETTISQIAKSAGIGKGTVYEYFESKEEIILTAFVHILDEFDKYMDEAFVVSEVPIETIRSFIYAMTSFYEHADKDTMILIMMFQIGSAMQSNRKYEKYLEKIIEIKSKSFLKYYPTIIDAIQNALEDKEFRPINPMNLLWIIFFFISGSAMMSIFSHAAHKTQFEGINDNSIVDSFIDILLNGLYNQPNGGKS